MSDREQALRQDVAAVGRLDAVPLILDVVCRATGMRFAAVARVTEDRWIACSVRDEINFGLAPGGELKVETTICNEIRRSALPVFIDDVPNDPVYCGHATPAMYGFRSYVSVPIVRADGTFFGTLCAIDPAPAAVNTPHVTGLFRLLAELIAFHLDAQDRAAATEATLRAQHEMAELREQFIAVLGHDLRNPLTAINAGTHQLSRQSLNERGRAVLGLMQGSVRRMAELIDHLMDFARVRFGDGLAVRHDVEAVGPALAQVLAEARATWPDRRIDADFAALPPFRCDHSRVAELFSNLLANAITHGAVDEPIRVAAGVRGGVFELSVANAGVPIPPAIMERLFQPFFRATAGNSNGLGLGLFIAAAIARAHGGTLGVTSTEAETRFTFRIPAPPAEAA